MQGSEALRLGQMTVLAHAQLPAYDESANEEITEGKQPPNLNSVREILPKRKKPVSADYYEYHSR
jgi:hypothetical protein